MDDKQPTIERWRDIPGHPGYQVSDHGRVRGLDRTTTTTNGQVRHYKGKILSTPLNTGGYQTVHLYTHGKSRKRYVHALVAEAFIGPRPEGMEVCHNDGDPTNNSLENLRYGTRSDNMLDRVRHGTDPQASRTHCSLGHELFAENLRASVAKLGHRKCLACNRARAYLHRHPELKPQLQAVADSYYQAILNKRKYAA